MKEKRWHFTDEHQLRKLWKDYGAENGLSFKDFKKWIEKEATSMIKKVRNE